MKDTETALKQAEAGMTAAEFIASIAPMTASSGQIDILKKLGTLTPEDSILEIWCGGGDLTAQLAEIGGQVFGADYSKKLIEAAAQRFPHITFAESGTASLAFPDAMFDVVVSNFTAHHYAKPEAVFCEAYRVLKPDGRLLITTPIQSKRTGFNIILDIARDSLTLPDKVITGGPLLDAAAVEDLAPVLKTAGFATIEGGVTTHQTECETLDTIFDYALKKIAPEGLEAKLWDKIRAAATLRMEAYRQDNGVYRFPDGILTVRAVK